MKNYMRRYFDPAAAEASGGEDPVIKAVKDLGITHKTQIEGIKTELTVAVNNVKTELQEEISRGKATAQKAADDVEEIKNKMNTSGMGVGGQQKNYSQELQEKLASKSDKLKRGSYKGFNLELDTKVVGNFASSTSLTGTYFVAPDVRPGVFVQPFNEVHMRNLLITGTTSSNTVRYVRDNGGEGGPAMVAEGAAKPQMDRDLEILDAVVRKLATYMRVPEEMIEDIEFLTSFLTEVGTQEVLAVEDTQILYGDGLSQNLDGLFENATAFAAPAVVGAPNEFDVLRAAQTQMRNLKRTPSFALVSPTDYYKMVSRKDTTNNYVLSGGGNGLTPSLDGVPIVQLNQITAGDFLVMDSRAAQILWRSNIVVRFYDQDQDNAIKNLITIVIEERLALPIYYTTGLIKGTFSAAITDLTS